MKLYFKVFLLISQKNNHIIIKNSTQVLYIYFYIFTSSVPELAP